MDAAREELPEADENEVAKLALRKLGEAFKEAAAELGSDEEYGG
jgi:hypothetical protein